MKKFLSVLIVSMALKAGAQDPRFSQFHLAPLYINPAMTGFFDGDVRFAAIYRNQWFTLGSPYGSTKFETEAGSVDGCIRVGQRKEDYIGVGGAFVRDVAGDQAFTLTFGTLNVAYSKSFGYHIKQSIAIGLDAEVLARQFRNGGAVFPDGIVENIGSQNIRITAGAGIRYHAIFNKRLNMYLGFAVAHVTQPTESILAVNGDKLFIKYTFHGAAVVEASDKYNIVPNLMFLAQGPSIEASVGASAQYIFGDNYNSKNSFSFGLNMRFTEGDGADAIIPNVRLDYYNFTVGVSYDVNISNLSRGTNTVGAIEVGVIYIFKRKSLGPRTNVSCPTW